MKLYVVRHGAADDLAPSMQDFDRALTEKGRKRTREVGKTLRHASAVPRVVLSSPLVRALQTAEILQSSFDPDRPVIARRELAPGGDLRALAVELASSGASDAMIVGHEPDLSDFVYALLGGPFTRPFLKSMVVCLQLDRHGRTAKLDFVLDPKSLEIERS